MPTTYTPLATTTLGSSQASVTLSVISGAYTDLVLVISAQGTTAGNDQDINMTFNSDTGSNYSRTRLYGNGTSALSTRDSNASSITIGNMPAASSSLGAGNSVVQINNYSNSTTNKTALIRTNTASTYGTVFAIVGLWRSTAAITSITLTPAANSFAAGSTFSLYGIASAAVVSGAKATGGDVVATDGTYWYHAFRTSGTFTPSSTLSCDVLVVAGGGSGGWPYSGGGGAGGVIAFSAQSLSTAQTVTVGGGGAGAYNTGNGQQGSNSVFGSLTSAVGGGGGVGDSTATTARNGGSGGGGSAYSRNIAGNTGGTGTTGQGNNGGTGSPSSYTNEGGGGGGGAGAVGSNATGTNSGNGGAGTNSVTNWGALSGVLTTTGLGVSGFIAGGGGGGTNGVAANAGNGGSGGGGRGASNDGTRESEAGTMNTGSGSGGGGAGGAPASPKNGGSGIIIVRYPV
jgi:hypothetical protein